MLPLFVDKELVGAEAPRATYGENEVTRGKLLGSDNLAVISWSNRWGVR